MPDTAYRLIAHTLPQSGLALFQKKIWHALAGSKIIPCVSPKDRYASRAQGGRGLNHMPTAVNFKTVNACTRYLRYQGPPDTVGVRRLMLSPFRNLPSPTTCKTKLLMRPMPWAWRFIWRARGSTHHMTS